MASDVERRVQDAIAGVAGRRARSIRVTMSDGIAHLHGELPSLWALRTAVQAAKTAPGVTTVESRIVVSP
jgi:osmotically-inducible protein OsmY